MSDYAEVGRDLRTELERLRAENERLRADAARMRHLILHEIPRNEAQRIKSHSDAWRERAEKSEAAAAAMRAALDDGYALMQATPEGSAWVERVHVLTATDAGRALLERVGRMQRALTEMVLEPIGNRDAVWYHDHAASALESTDG